MKHLYKFLAFSFVIALATNPAFAQTERLGGFVDGSNQTLTASLAEVVTDGSFEAGAFGGTWTEMSTNFGTPICDDGGCGNGTGTGPNTGLFWAWFGGIAAAEEGSVSQNVTIGATGTATLTFFKEQIVCDSNFDYVEVLVNGNQEFLANGADPTCGALGYTQYSVNLNGYANVAPVTLEFHSG